MVNTIKMKKAFNAMRKATDDMSVYQWIISVGRKTVSLVLLNKSNRVSIVIGERSDGMDIGDYVIANHVAETSHIKGILNQVRKSKNVKMTANNKEVKFDDLIVFDVIDSEVIELNVLDFNDVEFSGDKSTFDIMKKVIPTKFDGSKRHLHVIDISSAGAAWTDGYRLLVDHTAKSSTKLSLPVKLLGVVSILGNLVSVSKNDDSTTYWKFEDGEIVATYDFKYPPIEQVIPDYSAMFCEVSPKGFNKEKVRAIASVDKTGTRGKSKIYTEGDMAYLGHSNDAYRIELGKVDMPYDENINVDVNFLSDVIIGTGMRYIMRRGESANDVMLFENEKYKYVLMPLKSS